MCKIPGTDRQDGGDDSRHGDRKRRCFCQREIMDLCRKVIDDDDQVDDAFNQIKEELAELMYQNLDAKTGLDLLMTAKYMERIGDHAVNIAEWVEYAITGVHRNNEHQLGGH